MKAITLHQPWASLIACGAKRIETRSWKPPAPLIGTEFAIHAGKTKFGGPLVNSLEFMNAVDEALGEGWPQMMPYGAVVSTAVIDEVHLINDPNIVPSFLYARRIPLTERVFGYFNRGRYMWVIKHVKPLDPPVAASGRQGFWEWMPPQGRRLL